jgi:hypothetical protein
VVRSGRKRKRGFRIIAVLGIFLLFAGVGMTVLAYQYFTSPDRFVARTLVVENSVFADPEAIRLRVREILGGNMLMVDLPELCDMVEDLPWVEDVAARKVLPDTLVLDVTESIPRAYAVIDGKLNLVDSKGEIIDLLRPEHPFVGLPAITGLEDKSQAAIAERLIFGMRILEDIRVNRPDWHERISEIDVSDPAAAAVLLRDASAPVVIGRGDPIVRLGKFFLIEAVLKERYDTVEHYDTRFDRRLIVKPVGQEQ